MHVVLSDKAPCFFIPILMNSLTPQSRVLCNLGGFSKKYKGLYMTANTPQVQSLEQTKEPASK